jgi:molecular chaperone GrpE
VKEDPQELSTEQPTNDTEQPNTEQPANTSNRTTDAAGRIAELETQLAQSRREASENWNKYLRERADWDNFRKRQERLVTDRVLLQKKSLFNNLLEVMDNVERALIYQETMGKEELQQVLRMLQWQMNEVFRGEGLSPVPTVGESFNPYVHEAVEAIADSDKPDGTILEELRKGYTLGEDTLRPARVKVSVGNK